MKENWTNNCPKIILPLLELLQVSQSKKFPGTKPKPKTRIFQLGLIVTKPKPKTNHMTNDFTKNQLIKAHYLYEITKWTHKHL